VLVFLAAAGLVLVALTGSLPEGTGTASLVVRGATGAAVGLLGLAFVRRMFRSLTEPPPPPPPLVDARVTDVVYVCIVCGTRLRLEVAATGKAPRHCGEEMDAQVAF
jgi:hypothetical protein